MSSYITNTDYNSNTGFFEITSTNADGTTSTQNVNFSTMCMMFSLNSLNAQDEVFAAQFAEAQEQVNTMTMINDCMQMLNTYNPVEGDELKSLNAEDMEAWKNIYYPNLVQTGLVQDGSNPDPAYGIGNDGKFHQDELDNFMENLQSAQSTVSSQNEQQMLITNDAASKRTSILQMAQSLMQAAADSRKSAAQS